MDAVGGEASCAGLRLDVGVEYRPVVPAFAAEGAGEAAVSAAPVYRPIADGAVRPRLANAAGVVSVASIVAFLGGAMASGRFAAVSLGERPSVVVASGVVGGEILVEKSPPDTSSAGGRRAGDGDRVGAAVVGLGGTADDAAVVGHRQVGAAIKGWRFVPS